MTVGQLLDKLEKYPRDIFVSGYVFYDDVSSDDDLLCLELTEVMLDEVDDLGEVKMVSLHFQVDTEKEG